MCRTAVCCRGIKEDTLASIRFSRLAMGAWTVNVIIILIASGVHQIDSRLYPGTYKALEVFLHFSPIQLGALSMAQNLAGNVVGPVWGFVSALYSQKWLLFASIASWSLTTFLVALSFNFESMLVFRILNGISLSMLVPLSQAIFADLFPPYVLGRAFGLMGAVSEVGALIGTTVSTAVSSKEVQLGGGGGAGAGGNRAVAAGVRVQGWRIPFLALAALAILLSIWQATRFTETRHHGKRMAGDGGGGGGSRRGGGGSTRPGVATTAATAAAATHTGDGGAGGGGGDDSDGGDSDRADAGDGERRVLIARDPDDRHDDLRSFLKSSSGGRRRSGEAVIVADRGGGGEEGGDASDGSGEASGDGEDDDDDDHDDNAEGEEAEEGLSKCQVCCFRAKMAFVDVVVMFKVPSFWIIVLQGVFGAIPWHTFGFLTLWLQYTGFTDGQAAVIMGVFVLGEAGGGLLGGFVADHLAQWRPGYGRILTAQISVGMGLPMLLLLTHVTPPFKYGTASPGLVVLMCAVVFTFGCLTTWCAWSVNRPIFTEIVPASVQGFGFSIFVSMEMAFASAGALVVGIVAEKQFGYKVLHVKMEEAQQATLDHNSYALKQSILWLSVVAWIICFGIYSLLYLTFPKDRKREAARALQQQREVAQAKAQRRRRWRQRRRGRRQQRQPQGASRAQASSPPLSSGPMPAATATTYLQAAESVGDDSGGGSGGGGSGGGGGGGGSGGGATGLGSQHLE